MLRKNYLNLFSICALMLAGSFAAAALTAPLRGKVELKKADGTTEPVAGAVIDLYRTDVKGKLPSSKTNKKGEFAFAGVPLGTFVVSVSAPNVKPEFYANVRAGSDNVNVTVVPGDGKRYTEDEVRQALSAPRTDPANASANASAPAAAQPAKPVELTAEQKKAKAEYDKEVAEVTAKNAKTQNNDALIKKVLGEGNKAFADKNYDVAIAKYDEGIAAEPDFAGSAPVMLNNKSQALLQKAIASYNQAVKNPDAAAKKSGLEETKSDLQEVVTASDRALTLLTGATAPDPATQKNYDANKFSALVNRKESYRLMAKTGVDTSKAKETATAFEEYLAAEPDAKKKADAQLALGDALREDGDAENAIVPYRKAFETSPENPDVLAGLGLSLFSAGAGSSPENTAQMQEGLNYMQKFADTAPENHPLKASVKDAVEYLKSKQLTPQKVTKGAAKKKS